MQRVPASWNVVLRSFASGAREDVVKRASEQTNDGIELFIADCHSAERSLSTSKRLLVKRQQSGKGTLVRTVAAPASLLAPSPGSQAGLASASGVDVIRPCHRIDRIPRPNPIPEGTEEYERFRDESAASHDIARPLGHFP